jgi:hypothetical protein
MWIELNPEEVESRGMEYVQERIRYYQALEDDPRTDKYRQAMQGMAEGGVLECDPDAVVSLGEQGAYVMTWSWIGKNCDKGGD